MLFLLTFGSESSLPRVIPQGCQTTGDSIREGLSRGLLGVDRTASPKATHKGFLCFPLTLGGDELAVMICGSDIVTYLSCS